MKSTGKLFAMKTLKNQQSKTYIQEHFLRERDVLRRVKNPFIVRLSHSFQDRDTFCFIMEYLSGGELSSLIQRSGPFIESNAAFYAAEILLGIEALHKEGIIYQDLKPENVLLDSNGHVKLIDFGLSKVSADEIKKHGTLCGTAEYMAPEVITSGKQSKAVDWWSLGIIIFELLSGHLPFEGENEKVLMENITKVLLLL